MPEKNLINSESNSLHQLISSRQLTNQTVALILAGGRGTRLKGLTTKQPKPALFFGGKFRIIDFTLSNCVNSGIFRIGVLTQYYSHSLIQHIQQSWSFLNDRVNEFIHILPAQQRDGCDEWYQGTADAIYQNLDIIKNYNKLKYILILAGDHIYKMDYSRMLLDHVTKGSKCTIACIEVPKTTASEFGIMHISEDNQIINFIEKPADPPSMPSNADMCLASMGIYVFDAQYLYQLLEEENTSIETHHDFGKDLIPKAVSQGVAWAHAFQNSSISSNDGEDIQHYWRDVGTIDAYWQANLDLASVTPELDMYDYNWSIHTAISPLPPAKFVQDRSGSQGMTMNSLISSGCIVSGSIIMNSVLFPAVRINSFCTIDSAVLLPEVHVSRSCRLHRCIIDNGCILPEGLIIGENVEDDQRRFYRSKSGIVLVTQEMLNKL